MSVIFEAVRHHWFFLVLILSQRLLVAQIDQYFEVSKDAFMERVTFKCENHTIYSDTVMECSQFCSMPDRRRCSAFALGRSICSVYPQGGAWQHRLKATSCGRNWASAGSVGKTSQDTKQPVISPMLWSSGSILVGIKNTTEMKQHINTSVHSSCQTITKEWLS